MTLVIGVIYFDIWARARKNGGLTKRFVECSFSQFRFRLTVATAPEISVYLLCLFIVIYCNIIVFRFFHKISSFINNVSQSNLPRHMAGGGQWTSIGNNDNSESDEMDVDDSSVLSTEAIKSS